MDRTKFKNRRIGCTNHRGEIAALAALARPRVAVVTNAGPAHLEGFGDLEGIARAKGEVFASLPPEGTAVINMDDPYAPLWREMAGGRRTLTFGLDAPADVNAFPESGGGPRKLVSAFRLSTPAGSVGVTLSLLGRHNVRNALAAAAAAWALDVPLEAIGRGLERVRPVRGRLQPLDGLGGERVVDDTYNANPGSLASALQAVNEEPGEKVLVLGDMAELGEHGWRWHEQAGRMAREQGFRRLLATGQLSRAAVEAFGAGAEHFPDHQALVARLRWVLRPGVVVLVKGSRCMHMERVVEALMDGAASSVRAVGRA
jgi:UDP-N-acetylmuramoyl-tripeptide--D-alanyl-D-alanine ligase